MSHGRSILDSRPVRLGLRLPKKPGAPAATVAVGATPANPCARAAPPQVDAPRVTTSSMADVQSAAIDQTGGGAVAPWATGDAVPLGDSGTEPGQTPACHAEVPGMDPPRHALRACGEGEGERNGPHLEHAASAMHPAERLAWRHACDWLALYCICRNARCHRAQRCRGEPVACLRAGAARAPQPVRDFVSRMMKAQELGLSVDEALDDAADDFDSYDAWIAGLEAARRRR